MTDTLLLTLFMFIGTQSQPPTTQIVNGPVQMKEVNIFKDGHRTPANLRTIRISTTSSEGKSALADIVMIYEPKSGAFWWRYQDIDPRQSKIEQPDLVRDWIVYISRDKVYGFSFSRPFLWIRESTEHFSSMDEGQAAILRDINSKADRAELGALISPKHVNIATALGDSFLSLKDSASLFPQPKLREVSRKKGQWHLIFDGPNKDSAEVVLSDDDQVVRTTHFPSK